MSIFGPYGKGYLRKIQKAVIFIALITLMTKISPETMTTPLEVEGGITILLLSGVAIAFYLLFMFAGMILILLETLWNNLINLLEKIRKRKSNERSNSRI